MTVRLFHSEDELSRRFGKEFVQLWRRLSQVYALKKRQVRVTSLHAASMAFLFYAAALSGDVETGHHFDNLLRGEWSDALEVDGQWVRLTDEASVDFVWDTAAIMLEVDSSLPDHAQWAYDIVGYHVFMAYQLTQAELTHEPLEETIRESISIEPSACHQTSPAVSQAPTPAQQNHSSSPALTSGQIGRFINHMNSLSSRDDRAAVANAIKCCMFDADHPDLALELDQAINDQTPSRAPTTVNNYYNGPIDHQINHQVKLDPSSSLKDS